MSILTILRNGVATVNKVTKSLQAKVSYERYVTEDLYGTSQYAPAVLLDAIVDWKQKQVRTQSGVLSVSRASITLIDIAQLAVATSDQGIDDNDLFTLPDGTTGPILDMSGFIDAGTGIPLATEVYLG